MFDADRQSICDVIINKRANDLSEEVSEQKRFTPHWYRSDTKRSFINTLKSNLLSEYTKEKNETFIQHKKKLELNCYSFRAYLKIVNGPFPSVHQKTYVWSDYDSPKTRITTKLLTLTENCREFSAFLETCNSAYLRWERGSTRHSFDAGVGHP